MQDRSKQLVGESPPWLSAQEHASRVAPLDRSVLVIGERGTGKELIGERLHFLSKRWEGPFVKVNCAALSETLLDSELFGHERGAFTGATDMRRGRFELADGGTIFLDEIATASPALQVKLLRVLQSMQFEAVGGSKTHAVDARVILAANEDLASLVATGRFRADLFWRINVVTIEMPTLRDRTADIPALAEHFDHYALHRQWLIKRLPTSEPWILAMGEKHPFFTIEKDFRVVPLSASWMKQALKDFSTYDIPANFHRAFLRTELLARGCSPQIIDAHLGHANFGEMPHSRMSTFDYHQHFVHLRKELQGLHDELGLQPIGSRLVPHKTRIGGA
jgi:hypothetical protein